MGTPLERELQYSEHKINQNFSNYSAWHYRTALLTALYAPEVPDADADARAAAALAAQTRLGSGSGWGRTV